MNELEGTMGIVCRVPENSVRLEITASVMMDDGDIKQAVMNVSPSELFEMHKDFLDYVGDDYDAVYALTEKGKAYLDEPED